MDDFQNSPRRSVSPSPGAARLKLRRLAQLMRVLSAAYAALLMFAYLFSWVLEVAEENRGFV